MVPQLHQHILSELDRSGRADTVFVFGAVVFDLLSIGVNSALATSKTGVAQVVFVLFMIGVVVVTGCAVGALVNGWRTCTAYHEALLKMYEAEGVAKYFPSSGLRLGRTRNMLFLLLTCSLGALAIIVPLLVRGAS
jgi:hypothetical protein